MQNAGRIDVSWCWGDYLHVSADAHKKLLQYLNTPQNQIWVATFRKVMDYLTKESLK